MPKKKFLSIQEVAGHFGVNATTVYRLTQKGKLPGFKIGNQWRFSEDLLESWVADQVTVKWLMEEEVAPAVSRVDAGVVRRKRPKLKSKHG